MSIFNNQQNDYNSREIYGLKTTNSPDQNYHIIKKYIDKNDGGTWTISTPGNYIINTTINTGNNYIQLARGVNVKLPNGNTAISGNIINNNTGIYDSMAVAPSAAAYGVGPAWIGGKAYWSDGSRLTPDAAFGAVPGLSPGYNLAAWTDADGGLNSIDPEIMSASILGGTTGGQINSGANAIGKSFGANLDLSNPADTYVAGTADYSQTLGYDNISNGLMSLNFGAHNLLYTACDHAFIMGARCRIEAGSRNTIVGHQSQIYGGASYSSIIGVMTGYVNSGANYNTIVGGNNQAINNVSAAYDTIIGGAANSITASGIYNTIIGTATGTISGTGGYGIIISGSTNSVTANKGRVIGGSGNTASGIDSCVIGSNSTASGQSSFALGESVKADAHGQLSLSGRVNAAAGDAQTDILNMSVQTTNNTDTTTRTAGSNGANVAAGAYCGEAYVIARKSDGTSASGFIIPFVFEKVGTTVTVRKGQTRTETTVLYDGLGITSANAPYIASASTYFSVTVQGLAATTINWSVSVRMARVV